MKLDFTLKPDITENTKADSLSIIHKLKSPIIQRKLDLEDKNAWIRLWQSDKKKIFKRFNDKILEFFNIDDTFYLLIPASNRSYFTDQLAEPILEIFSNGRDISGYFSKDQGISFGTEPYSSMSINDLKNYIHVNQTFEIDPKIKKVLIVDDVYSKGITFNVYESILKDKNPNLSFVGGTLVSTKNY